LRAIDETHSPERRSWVETANRHGCEFPIQNLPFGMFSRADEPARLGIAIGDSVLDVAAAANAGFVSGDAVAAIRSAEKSSLNLILGLEPRVLTDLRRQVADLLDENGPHKSALARRETLIAEQSQCRFHLPAQVGDYTDFFAGIHHASTTGAIAKPESPLPRNYKWTPIAYHGRASSVVVSGTGVHRPLGQVGQRGGNPPRYVPSARLDFELELGFYIGRGNPMGHPIDIAGAGEHIAGYCLLNDWSARDIQRWESEPLGPFLGKSFVTTVSPWVVTADALRPFRCAVMARDPDDPKPLPYLFDKADQENGGLDIELSVTLQTPQMQRDNVPAVPLTLSNARYLYWTPAQMVMYCGPVLRHPAGPIQAANFRSSIAF
jgi:fumarylacetoacetase